VDIHPDMTCMVRQMETTAQGVPLEIYCFTRTTSWADYERIQGDIFDYLLAVLPEFGLGVYQQPSGADLKTGLAGLSNIRNQREDELPPAPSR
jgi:miniconductance mechanosensitive channel